MKEFEKINTNKDNVENKDNIENKTKLDKNRILKNLFFIGVGVYCLILKSFIPTLTINLGDFGTIIPVLFHLVCVMGLKWCPVFSVFGLISIIFEKYVGDIYKIFIYIIAIITVVSTIILICL